MWIRYSTGLLNSAAALAFGVREIVSFEDGAGVIAHVVFAERRSGEVVLTPGLDRQTAQATLESLSESLKAKENFFDLKESKEGAEEAPENDGQT